uniref:Uncharacterized protein n=1 Tax=Anguilla anguilla TaxID=7936 RepID=A0A0E9XC75_ANGAN
MESMCAFFWFGLHLAKPDLGKLFKLHKGSSSVPS